MSAYGIEKTWIPDLNKCYYKKRWIRNGMLTIKERDGDLLMPTRNVIFIFVCANDTVSMPILFQ